MFKISLGEEELTKLLNGEVIQHGNYEIALKDIGMIRIAEIAFMAFINFVNKTSAEDIDQATLLLIKFHRMLKDLQNK